MGFKFFVLFLFPVMIFCGYEEPWGKDSHLLKKEQVKQPPPSFLTKLAYSIISVHHNFISPATGSKSSFRPTSSRYMELAMQRYGFFKGFVMGCDRLLRENGDPWIYKTICINGKEYKYDPAVLDKNKPLPTLR